VEWVLSRGSGIITMVQTLTPVNNMSVGELIPVSITDEAQSEEDSLSVPSYSEVSTMECPFNVFDLKFSLIYYCVLVILNQ
jgi:hypothetical protein